MGAEGKATVTDGVGPKTAALLVDGRCLKTIPGGELLPAWKAQWPQVQQWREMIKLDTKTELPEDLLTGLLTPSLPRAPALLEALGLW